MQSWLEGKCAQATGTTASLRILSSKADSNTWESFTRSELTSSGKGLPSHFWNRNIVRSILPGLKRTRTGLLLSGSKSSFQKKVHFSFNLEIKVPESGGRMERHRIHVAWSPVWSFHSQWWFGLPCHLLVLSTDNASLYQDILEHFMFPSADKLYGDVDFIFQQDLAPTQTAKSTKSWFNDHDVTVLDWSANSPDLKPKENLAIVKRKMRDTKPNNADDPKAAIKATWALLHLSIASLINSMPCRIDAVIHAKRGQPSIKCIEINILFRSLTFLFKMYFFIDHM